MRAPTRGDLFVPLRWGRVLAVWLLIAVAETVHGILRAALVAPALGDLGARQFGVWMGSGLLFGIALVAVRWIGAHTLRRQLQVGALWLLLMLLFEGILSLALGLPKERLAADYDPRLGGCLGFGMAFLALSPALAARARNLGRRWLWCGALMFCAATAVLFIALSFQRDLAAAHHRITGASELAHTPRGTIEYALRGTGTPVLLVHGSGGGFDQGLAVFADLAEVGFGLVAVSRFGYLRTPLPADPSAEAQADAHAALLDHLGIDRAAIVGASAGAPSAVQFALRHPERTAALVLLVPAIHAPRPDGAPSVLTPEATPWLFATALRSDFLFWVAPRVARGAVLRGILATPPEVVRGANEVERARVERLLENILPVRPRRLGLLNDGRLLSALPRYPLEEIRAPTLAISLEDDLFGTLEGAAHCAAHIPGARLLAYPTGGHVWVGRHESILEELAEFLRRHR